MLSAPKCVFNYNNWVTVQVHYIYNWICLKPTWGFKMKERKICTNHRSWCMSRCMRSKLKALISAAVLYKACILGPPWVNVVITNTVCVQRGKGKWKKKKHGKWNARKNIFPNVFILINIYCTILKYCSNSVPIYITTLPRMLCRYL